MALYKPLPPTRPITPPLIPFQQPPNTQNRKAHAKYLDIRLEDHIHDRAPLTPSFYQSWHAFQQSTEPKILQSRLIQEREAKGVQAEKDKLRRKHGSGKHVQKYGVIYKVHATSQILERVEDTRNMAMERKLKKVDKLFKDVVANIATHCEEFRYFYHTNEFKQR